MRDKCAYGGNDGFEISCVWYIFLDDASIWKQTNWIDKDSSNNNNDNNLFHSIVSPSL